MEEGSPRVNPGSILLLGLVVKTILLTLLPFLKIVKAYFY